MSKDSTTEAVGKAKPKTHSNSIEFDAKSASKAKGKLTAQLGKGIYHIYKKYCEALEKEILMPDMPLSMVARRLGKMVEAFNEFGFMSQDIEQFFVLLAKNHVGVSEYLEKHGVWQVKNHVHFMSDDFLAEHVNLFATWYKKHFSKTVKESTLANNNAKSLVEKKQSNEIIKPKVGPNLTRDGFTYHHKWNRRPEEQESSEFIHASYCHEDNQDEGMAIFYMSIVVKNAIKLEVSLERIEWLKTLTYEKFMELPMPH